jgi:hypothetical protein
MPRSAADLWSDAMTDTPERFTLRQLPLPAKLVLTVFLISVGLGYTSAMFQLHLKHASGGSALPTIADVVARFSGKLWPLVEWPAQNPGNGPGADANGKAAKEVGAAAPGQQAKVAGIKIKSLINDRCAKCHCPDGDHGEMPLTSFKEIEAQLGPTAETCKLLKVVCGDEDSWSKDSMVRAFTHKSDEDGKDWKNQKKERPEAELRAERTTEREALVAWLKAGAPEATYQSDAFPLPEKLAGAPLTERFKTLASPLSGPANGRQANAQNGNADPVALLIRKAKSRQMSVESLTQSTHAHLLSFAMLWAITGFIFAFTSYPLWMRVALAPTVLLAQVLDVSCWWLARLDGVGPYFALAIMGTGAVVGLGLIGQIMLSVFNMYGCKGKTVLAALFVAGAVGFGSLYVNHIEPFLASERQEAQAGPK